MAVTAHYVDASVWIELKRWTLVCSLFRRKVIKWGVGAERFIRVGRRMDVALSRATAEEMEGMRWQCYERSWLIYDTI